MNKYRFIRKNRKKNPNGGRCFITDKIYEAVEENNDMILLQSEMKDFIWCKIGIDIIEVV